MKLISVERVRDTLKEHFPEYLSGSCLCGHPVGTYMMWIEHVAALLESDGPSGQPESDAGYLKPSPEAQFRAEWDILPGAEDDRKER